MSLFTWFPSYSVGSSAFLRLVWRFHFSLRAIVEAWVICGTSRGTGNKRVTRMALCTPWQLPLEAVPWSLCEQYSCTLSEPEATQARYAAVGWLLPRQPWKFFAHVAVPGSRGLTPATFIHHHQVWLPVSQSEPSQQTLKDLHWILPFPAGS